MTVVPIAQAMTADEFLAAPAAECGRPVNLVNGEVVVNDPSALHGHIQGNLFFALESWARAKTGRGHAVFPRDIAVDELNVFAPDVLWYSDGRLPAPDSPPPYAMPNLAVEVRSPSTWRYDVGAKRAGYERHGLPELWLVDSVAATVLVFRRSTSGFDAFDVALEFEGSAELGSTLLPGFSVSVDHLFQIP